MLIKIGTPKKIRFKRLIRRRRKSDPKTYKEFVKLEERDLGINQDSRVQQHSAVFALAEKEIVNDSIIYALTEKTKQLIKQINTKT